MAHTLEIRKTHGYVGTYRDLDQWETIGTFKVLGEGPITWKDVDEEDYCYAGTRVYVVSVESDARHDDIRRALQDQYSSHGCAHEHDCCGCISTYATATKQSDRLDDTQWIVIVTSTRNY